MAAMWVWGRRAGGWWDGGLEADKGESGYNSSRDPRAGAARVAPQVPTPRRPQP